MANKAPLVLAMVSLLLLVLVVVPTGATSAKRRHQIVLRYYSHQQFGVNEFVNVNASVAAVNGTQTGVGLGVVYAYPITATPNTTSPSIGFIRGTSTVASNTLPATYFVARTVVHYSDPTFKRTPKSKNNIGLQGTFTTQGEADFTSGQPWEYAITGGTGDFRNTFGYTIGRVYSRTPTATTAILVTLYETYLWI